MRHTVTTAEQLAELMPKLKPGEVVSYHVGDLVADAAREMRVARVGDMARRLSTMLLPTVDNALAVGMGYCTLMQRRASLGVREYLAIRISGKRGG
jgi:hypothetical protein